MEQSKIDAKAKQINNAYREVGEIAEDGFRIGVSFMEKEVNSLIQERDTLKVKLNEILGGVPTNVYLTKN